ncbi:MAG: N-acetyltransferase [Flavobacteriaceae bacterium TMED120]|nr:MAG: N-acetyltransferase [Flavobacteriaceae bacterium TMED120]
MIEIREIESRRELVDFVHFPFQLYKGNPYWVPPIVKEELEMLDKKVNPVFNNALAHYFLAYKDGEIVGRIAAFINWIEIKELKKSKVRFGWFDVIDDLEVTKKLIDAVVAIGKQHQMTAIEGPMGFSNMDKAGMLTKGFEELNTMITWYNAPYYSEHLEKITFTKQAEWVEYEIKISSFQDSPEKVKRFSKLILQRYQLKILDFKSHKEIVPYVEQMFDLLGKTYDKLQTFVPIQEYQIAHYKERYLPFVHPDYIKCIVDSDQDLIAFAITMPSFSKALKKMNGKILPWGFFHLFKARYFNNRASFYLIGVRPDYQNKGITAIIFNEMQKTFNKHGVTIVETNPELVENNAIQKLWRNYEHRQHKRRVTFTKSI